MELPENRSALQAVRRLARYLTDSEGRKKPPPAVFLHGPPGAGKSHLVNGLVDEVLAEGKGRSAQVIAAVDLGRLLTVPPAKNDPRRELRACDLLVVEDVQHLPAAAADGFAALLDHRQSRSGCFLATASAGPAALGGLPARLTSRLGGGLVVGVEPLSLASRRELVTAFCRERGVNATDEVIDWVARETPGGARPLQGAVSRLEALARELPQPLNLVAISAHLPADGGRDGSPVERIAGRVAERFGVTVKQLQGKARQKNVLWPRQVAMFLAREAAGLPLARIGAFFGGRDHTTVLHACQKVEEARAADPALAKTLRQLKAELG